MSAATTKHPNHPVEWQTIALIVSVWIAFGVTTYFWRDLTWAVAAPLGAYIVCLFGSLHHEAVHGHPTRSALINEVLVGLPIGLLFPYRRYRSLHLTHHNNDHLTDPVIDPESYYMEPDSWRSLPGPLKVLYTINNTFAGRMLIGPLLTAISYLSDEIKAVLGGNWQIARIWAVHLVGVAVVWVWVSQVCAMPFWQYALFIAYPGMSLTLMRSYAEHRAHQKTGCRTIIVEANPLIGLMFLNNNLHMAHHERPAMAWYDLPTYYRTNRARLLEDNCGYLIMGYWRLIAKYGLKPKEPVEHPMPGSLAGKPISH